MKKAYKIIFSILFISSFLFSSCKKKEDPAPIITNAAPAFIPQATTSKTTFPGYSADWRLTNIVRDAEGDSWTVTSVRSSNTAIVTTGLATDAVNNPEQSIFYSGVSLGTATLSIVVTDSRGASNTLTATVTVVPNPSSF